MTEFLNNILKTLDKIEVHGKDNLDLLLGCMMAIENAIRQLNETTKEEVADG